MAPGSALAAGEHDGTGSRQLVSLVHWLPHISDGMSFRLLEGRVSMSAGCNSVGRLVAGGLLAVMRERLRVGTRCNIVVEWHWSTQRWGSDG